jgi:queuine tRNA-ribosyltransferase
MHTARGVVDTPAFMAVATQGSVKSLVPADLRAAGAQIVLANTYHLFLRPGSEVIRGLGGLHRFMAWDGPILTDSGGFQVWSLAKLRTLSEEGVEFRSHIDGSLRMLTPESCIEIQRALGVDIIHPLDECLAQPATEAETERSLALTMRWFDRALRAHRAGGADQALFAIVQGGVSERLRRRAVEEAVARDYPGYSIGGLAVGEPRERMYDIAELVAGILPADRPRYLMGVGKPPDLVEAVARGVDLFDCVMPTRNARNGQVFTPDGPLTIGHARYARGPRRSTPTAAAGVPAFSRLSRHLFAARELTAYRLSPCTTSPSTSLTGGDAARRRRGQFRPFRARFLIVWEESGRDSGCGRFGGLTSSTMKFQGTGVRSDRLMGKRPGWGTDG